MVEINAADVFKHLHNTAVAITTSDSSQFNPADKTTALRCAKLSKLAYQPYSAVVQDLSTYGLQAEMEISDKVTGTEGFIASDSSSITVVFRGTSGIVDIATDLQFDAVPIGPGLPKAHEGFVKAFNAVYPSIEEKLKPHLGQKQLIITGHSLGGALASLLSYRLSLDHPPCQPKLYAFGCPPVGAKTFSESFKKGPSNIITIIGDPVSTGLIILLGEKHDLYKPVVAEYLPEPGGHGIAEYIEQIEKL